MTERLVSGFSPARRRGRKDSAYPPHSAPKASAVPSTGRQGKTKDGQAAQSFLEGRTRRCVLKSKTIRPGEVELNLEVRMKDGDTGFVNTLGDMEGVRSAVLVSYNGDYMG